MEEKLIKLIQNNTIILADVDEISGCALTSKFTCDITKIKNIEDLSDGICIIPEHALDEIELVKFAIEQTQISLYLYIEYNETEPELSMNTSQFDLWLDEAKQTIEEWLPKLYQLDKSTRLHFAERNINILN